MERGPVFKDEVADLESCCHDGKCHGPIFVNSDPEATRTALDRASARSYDSLTRVLRPRPASPEGDEPPS